MALVYSSNVIEIAVVHDYASKVAVNVWHMYHDQEIGDIGQENVVEDFRNNWQDHIMPELNEDVEIIRFDWRSLDEVDQGGGTVLPDPGKPLVGGVVGQGSPPQVAWLVHKNTSNRPRGRRDGRAYLPGVNEAEVFSGGGLAPAKVTTFDAALVDFYNGISDTSANWAGDSYPVVLETTPASRAPGTTPVVIDSRRVTSLSLDSVVATQRERNR